MLVVTTAYLRFFLKLLVMIFPHLCRTYFLSIELSSSLAQSQLSSLVHALFAQMHADSIV